MHGCLRSKELLDLNINDVKQNGMIYQVRVFVSKSNTYKTFHTSEEAFPVLEKYIKLRPTEIDRFLVQYRNGKCTRQVILILFNNLKPNSMKNKE